MNKIIFTGTAPGLPSASRASSSWILKTAGAIYQFEAGEGVASALLKHRIDHKEIDAVFISHLHPDHITGIFLELQLMYLTAREKPLDIYVPEEAVEGLGKTADMSYLFKEKFPFEFAFKPIRPNPIYRAGDFELLAYHNDHLTPNAATIKRYQKPNKMQSYSFLFRIRNKKVLYSGDVLNEHELEDLLDDIHTVIVEGLHVDFGAIIRLCVDNKVSRLVITHAGDKIIERPDRLLRLAEKAGLQKIVIATDGLQLNL